VFAFFLSLGAGVRAVIQGEIFPIERLEVVPARGGLSALGLVAGGAGSGPTIPEATVGEVGRLPGVRAVYPRMRFAFPAKAWGGEKVFGQTMWTEVVADGIPAVLVEDELGADTIFRDWSAEDSGAACATDGDCDASEYCGHAGTARACMHPVPFLVSRYLVETYNGALVAAHGLPELPEWVLRKGRGMRLHMDVGRSSLGNAPHGSPRQVQIAFAGVSEQAMDIGLTVPLAYVKRWNEEFVGPEAASGYSSLSVVVGDRDEVTYVAERLKRLGLAIRSRGEEQVGLMITIFESTFAILAVLILVISAFNITHAFFLIARDRRREIGIMRAVGATRADILGSFVLEGIAIGLAGSVLGLASAYLLSVAGNLLAARYVPDFPFKPDDFFHFSARLVVVSLATGTLSCLVGALPPAVRASPEDPTMSLM
jgi:putative ABC transport system permease protein